MTESLLDVLRTSGLLDSGVLAVGVERGWASCRDVSAYAIDRLSTGDERAGVVELATAEDLDSDEVSVLLRRWAHLDGLPSGSADSAMRRWMFASVKAIAQSDASPEEKLDKLEEAYAALGYPEDMRECSRYYVPTQDRARGIRVGEVSASPLDAMNQLLSRLAKEFGLQ